LLFIGLLLCCEQWSRKVHWENGVRHWIWIIVTVLLSHRFVFLLLLLKLLNWFKRWISGWLNRLKILKCLSWHLLLLNNSSYLLSVRASSHFKPHLSLS
jgi:hypothetical protein